MFLLLATQDRAKTVVAAAIVKQRLDLNDNLRCLILVPTRELVNQQAHVRERWCPGSVIRRYHGGLSSKQGNFHALVSSPAAFNTLLATHKQLEAIRLGFLLACWLSLMRSTMYLLRIFLIAALPRVYQHGIAPRKVQVLGLSASLTYNVSEVKIKEALNQVCKDLSIEIILSPSVEKLEADGYVPQSYGRMFEVLKTDHSPEGECLNLPGSRI